MFYVSSMNVILTCFIRHAVVVMSYQCQLCRFTANYKSFHVASWESKCALQNLAGSTVVGHPGTFHPLLVFYEYSDFEILILHTVFCLLYSSEVCDFSRAYDWVLITRYLNLKSDFKERRVQNE